ncbi:MAG: hypothetical protein A3G32_06435 [Deltaproteobacteria bacterium RIFCSPLOWO2_12_FULL_40_28]|nr:MAG: hypothetical protein A3C45_02530 [Deltaproteobacteria bacterium RIFCSPHIGHO2_02_FULL_40_28]OGQ19087.1 MAG: hypothetical protein A3E27_05620 [Deltaproteobacteria bacterium RIFCSPHIGHO2_12_FULL_40_32]OGQ40259.1 MAG: hypothetical protein A3I69_01060 [Deltaproteobacteria bacterium RIFCSPLOWO2_02_FULL_40_36]OGQ53530.1 MAG: hypothetical protein A3G32_06435 [Deltaproteobacteria bacterium RIFCSPLOWO2_12_FULL_40_28]
MSDRSVLIDTSIWIEYFRGKNHQFLSVVDVLLDEDRVVNVDLVCAELYRGARSEKEIRFLEQHFSAIPSLQVPVDVWRLVGKFSFQLAKKGYLPHLVDAYIAFTAIEHNVTLFTKDRDFQHMARLGPLKLYQLK